jgi:hypothetical protein
MGAEEAEGGQVGAEEEVGDSLVAEDLPCGAVFMVAAHMEAVGLVKEAVTVTDPWDSQHPFFETACTEEEEEEQEQSLSGRMDPSDIWIHGIVLTIWVVAACIAAWVQVAASHRK